MLAENRYKPMLPPVYRGAQSFEHVFACKSNLRAVREAKYVVVLAGPLL